jgi:hypothetical protein
LLHDFQLCIDFVTDTIPRQIWLDVVQTTVTLKGFTTPPPGAPLWAVGLVQVHQYPMPTPVNCSNRLPSVSYFPPSVIDPSFSASLTGSEDVWPTDYFYVCIFDGAIWHEQATYLTLGQL